MHVFVTGGSGYVGREVLRALVARGDRVTALARSATAVAAVGGVGAEPLPGGVGDLELLESAARDADGAIHLAQASGPDVAAVDLAAARWIRAGLRGRPYVHTGGVWVYGSTSTPTDETAPFDPVPYLAWRVRNERTLLAEPGHIAVVMPGVVYGRGGGLLESSVASAARRDGTAVCVGDGRQRVAVVHVDDLADLYVRALGAPSGARYAAVADESPTALELVEAVAGGRPVEHCDPDTAMARLGRVAAGLALDQRLSNARARTELGWLPAGLSVRATYLDAVAPAVVRPATTSSGAGQ